MPENVDQQATQEKRRFWERQIGYWRKSGLSQLAYCRKHDLKPHRFYYWRRRILKPRPEVSFLPVTLPANLPPHSQLMRILMPNGCILELEGQTEPEQLARLLTVVAAL